MSTMQQDLKQKLLETTHELDTLEIREMEDRINGRYYNRYAFGQEKLRKEIEELTKQLGDEILGNTANTTETAIYPRDPS